MINIFQCPSSLCLSFGAVESDFSLGGDLGTQRVKFFLFLSVCLSVSLSLSGLTLYSDLKNGKEKYTDIVVG